MKVVAIRTNAATPKEVFAEVVDQGTSLQRNGFTQDVPLNSLIFVSESSILKIQFVGGFIEYVPVGTLVVVRSSGSNQDKIAETAQPLLVTQPIITVLDGSILI